MTAPKDPPRLFESLDAPSELRNLLECAHEDRLTDVQSAHLLGLFEHQLKPHLGSLDSARSVRNSGHFGNSATNARLSAKALCAVAAIGIGSIGVLAVSQHQQSPKARESARPFEHVSSKAPAVALPTNVGVSRAPLTPPAAAEELRGATTPRATEPAAANGSAPRVAIASSGSTSALALVEAGEYSLVRAARDAVVQNPTRALALADQHARQFPNGMLGQEREAIAVDALVRGGRADQAKVRGERFLLAYPKSPYRKRIEAAIGQSAGKRATP